jgi:hypothetical protein
VPYQDAGVLIVLGAMSLEHYGRTRLSPGSNAGNAAKDPMGSARLITIDCMGEFGNWSELGEDCRSRMPVLAREFPKDELERGDWSHHAGSG